MREREADAADPPMLSFANLRGPVRCRVTGSGDLLADRRFAWARALADDGDHIAAADLFEQVVARVPGWAAGWAGLGDARERAGDADGARSAWGRVAALDQDGALGAALRLARLDGETPGSMPESYVAALFDAYAPRFERHLTEALGYRGPRQILDALEVVAPGRHFDHALDLGCGTGLMGLALQDRAACIDGVDLSPAMIERARATGVYADLAVAPIAAALAAADPARYDLVTAADVLAYVGDLRPLLAGVARALAPGGLFAFTVQSLEGDAAAPRDVVLGADLRYAHAPAYVEAALQAAAMRPILRRAGWARRERGLPVPGFVAVAAH